MNEMVLCNDMQNVLTFGDHVKDMNLTVVCRLHDRCETESSCPEDCWEGG